MIITRAPLRISFVGGGTDFPDFYKHYIGKVISTTIDKYVYVTINSSSLLKGITARYSEIEHVDKIEDLKNDRIREVMKYFKIKSPVEVSVMSDLPVGFGLGGSSAFMVALIKAFSIYKQQALSEIEIAKLACIMEIKKLREPIGKQDQFAATFGGLNLMEFYPDTVTRITRFRLVQELSKYLCLFYLGNTRQAKMVLAEQQQRLQSNLQVLQGMTILVDLFVQALMAGEMNKLGKILHDGWTMKKTLAPVISNPKIDNYYQKAIKAGVWGGKVCGAGGGGCLLFIAPPNKHKAIKEALNLQQIPFKFSQEGVEVING